MVMSACCWASACGGGGGVGGGGGGGGAARRELFVQQRRVEMGTVQVVVRRGRRGHVRSHVYMQTIHTKETE